MADSTIAQYLNKILEAVYGKDVRRAIYDSISQCYSDVNNPVLIYGALEQAVQEKIDDGTIPAMTLADGSITPEKLSDEVINLLQRSGYIYDEDGNAYEQYVSNGEVKLKRAYFYTVDTTIPVGAVEPELSEWDYVISNGKLVLQEYKGISKNIIIPKSYYVSGEEYTVSVNGNRNIFGDEVEYITFKSGVEMFNGVLNCGGSTKLIGCSNVPIMGTTSVSMQGCTALKFIDNLGKLQNLKSINMRECTALEQIPDLSSLINITDGFVNAFYGCTALKQVFGLPPNLTTMRSAFFNCPLEYLGCSVPSGVTDMQWAFTGNRLSEVTITAENVNNVENTFENKTGGRVDHFIRINISKGSTTAAALLKKYKAQSVRFSYINDKLLTITAWGDSITSSDQFGTFGSWMTGLMTYLPEVFCNNMAISGETTLSTSARQGGNTICVKEGIIIPADNSSVPITVQDKNGNTFSQSSPLLTDHINPCKVENIEGTITNNSGNLTFQRYEAGDEVTVQAGTEITPYGKLYNNSFTDVMIIYMGTNDGWNKDNETLMGQIDDMIGCYGKSNYIVISPCSGKYVRDEEGIQNIKNLETAMAEKYGNKYINLREKMIAGVLEFNGLSATEEDTSRMAIGQIPRTVLASASDDTHGNDYFHKYLAKLVYDKLTELGYVA